MLNDEHGRRKVNSGEHWVGAADSGSIKGAAMPCRRMSGKFNECMAPGAPGRLWHGDVAKRQESRGIAVARRAAKYHQPSWKVGLMSAVWCGAVQAR